MQQLSEEINQRVAATAPFIVFFGLPEAEQIAVLPTLDERKYSFPDGDLTTSNALEVLVSGYNACLNSLSIRLMIMQDESSNEDIEDLVDLIDKLLETTLKLLEEQFNVVDNADHLRTSVWESLRQLSSTVQQKLEIQLVINTAIVRDCVEYWLHP